MHSGQRRDFTPRSGSTREEAFLGNPEGSQSKTADSAPARRSGKDNPFRTEIREPSGEERPVGRGSAYPKNSVVHLATKEWTRITRKKEINVPSKGRRTHRATFPVPLPSKEDGKNTIAPTPFYPDILFIQGRLESAPISDDEPTMQGEEPPQRDARRWRNRRRNMR
jgi:hypothetical protein